MLALRRLAFPAFIALLLFSQACQTSTIVSNLEAVVSAAGIAIPVIGAATGLNPHTSTLIVSYLQQVNIATAQAATILADKKTTPQEKTAAILKALNKIAGDCRCIPPGTPQEVVAVVNAVAQAVLNFMSHFLSQGIVNTIPGQNVKISAADRIALGKLRLRSEQNAAKLKGVTK